jgi:hypothetical protein
MREGRSEGVTDGLLCIHVNQLLRDDQSIVAHEGATRGPDPLLAIGCERDVGGSGVAAVEGPFGLAVADDEAARGRHACLRPRRSRGER